MYLASMSGAFKALERRIDVAADRWNVDFVPELSELQPIRDTDGRELMNEEQQRTQAIKKAADAIELDEREAERIAEELNETNEKAEQRAAEIRARFERR